MAQTILCEHTAATDPLFGKVAPAPGSSVVFQMQEVWDARATREYGAFITFLDSEVPFNAVLSVKFCEVGKECPKDLVAQVDVPFLAGLGDVSQVR